MVNAEKTNSKKITASKLRHWWSANPTALLMDYESTTVTIEIASED
jgi:hypothetical protein